MSRAPFVVITSLSLCWLVACDQPLAVDGTTPCLTPSVAVASSDTLDALPSWDYGLLLAASPFGPGRSGVPLWEQSSVANPRILAWYRESDGTWRQDHALVWLRLVINSDSVGWSLIHFVGNGDIGSWVRAPVADVPNYPVAVFDHAPTNAEIITFLSVHSAWTFNPSGAATIIDGDVRESTWLYTVGAAPTQTFPNEFNRACRRLTDGA